jgi:hypothetical protein
VFQACRINDLELVDPTGIEPAAGPTCPNSRIAREWSPTGKERGRPLDFPLSSDNQYSALKGRQFGRVWRMGSAAITQRDTA